MFKIYQTSLNILKCYLKLLITVLKKILFLHSKELTKPTKTFLSNVWEWSVGVLLIMQIIHIHGNIMNGQLNVDSYHTYIAKPKSSFTWTLLTAPNFLWFIQCYISAYSDNRARHMCKEMWLKGAVKKKCSHNMKVNSTLVSLILYLHYNSQINLVL